MSENFATVDEPLQPAQALHINDICDRFEAAWKASAVGTSRPRIEDYLDGTAGGERNALLRYLVLLEIDYRRGRGEKPTAAEYQARFRGLSDHFLAEGMAVGPSQQAPAPVAAKGPAEPA